MKSKLAYSCGDMVGGTSYKVLRVLGAGGMGTVYEVEDTSVGKRYVLKTLHVDLAPRADLEEMMRHEGRALAKVQHPHIVDVITAGKTKDRFSLPFIVMEWLDGATLRAIASSAHLSHEDILKIATELLEALYHMHQGDPEKGRPPVIHRDIKRENIFLARGQNGAIVKLLDLGIAVLLDGQTHGTCGTPKYMAPEQFRGEALSAQTDLYQVACVFFELLTGRHPFANAKTTQELIQAHLGTTPPRVSKLVKVPKRVDDVIAAALSKAPGDRPRDAYAFMVAMRDLRDAVGGRAPVNNTTIPDLNTAIERQTESGYEAYATAEGTLEDPFPAFVIATTARLGAASTVGPGRSSTVPMAPAVRASLAPGEVDRAALTRSYREAPRRRPDAGTEELLDGLDGLPAPIADLRERARSTPSPVAPAPAIVTSARSRMSSSSAAHAAASVPADETPLAAGVQTKPVTPSGGKRGLGAIFNPSFVVAAVAVGLAVVSFVTRQRSGPPGITVSSQPSAVLAASPLAGSSTSAPSEAPARAIASAAVATAATTTSPVATSTASIEASPSAAAPKTVPTARRSPALSTAAPAAVVPSSGSPARALGSASASASAKPVAAASADPAPAPPAGDQSFMRFLEK